MKTRFKALVGVVAVGLAALLLPGPARGETPSVLDAERMRIEALVKADVAALDKLLGSELRYVHSSGIVETKADFVGGIQTGRYKYKAIVPDGVSTREYGDTALVTGNATVDVTSGGRNLHLLLRFTEVWVKRDGGWQMVAWQSTRAPETAPAPPLAK